MESPSGPVGVPVGDSISEPVWDPDRGRSGVKNGDSILKEMESPTGALGC